MNIENRIAQCVGLWLAEGDQNTKREITFTNNQFMLIKYFHKTLKKIFVFKNNPRVYIYSPYKAYKLDFLLDDTVFRYYVDKRANKPYFVYRVSGRYLVQEWLELIKKTVVREDFYVNILRGLFAGEGNVKYIEKSKARVLRIAQGKQNQLIEKILNHLKIKYSYSSSERAYVISGKENLTKMMKIKVSYLHPEKHQKFVHMYHTYKEEHYPRGQLKNLILKTIEDRPKTSSELSKIFNRDQSRITKVLIDLKNMGKVKNYRARSLTYWTANKNIIIISDRKNSILSLLKIPKRTSDVSKLMKVDPKSSFKRLKELKKLNLVERDGRGLWHKIQTNHQIIVA